MNETSQDLFGFAESEEARQQLSHDLDDLHVCMKSNANKPAMVMIGSLIESVLYYHIESIEAIKKKIGNFEKRNVHLSDLLGWAKQFGIIDDGLYKLADPIRDYRNLIHPRVQIRLGVQVSEALVQIGYNVLLEIIRSVNKHANSLNSQKADKVIAKIMQEICTREPNDADTKIYSPILEKYGFERGRLIIEKSLRFSSRRRK
jgi:hypothetical protein